MAREKFIQKCDQIIACSFYAMIYFLPISSYLAETGANVSILTYMFKHIAIFLNDLDALKARHAPVTLKTKILTFFRAFKPVATPINRPVALWLMFCGISVIFGDYFYFRLEYRAFFGKVLQSVYIFFVFTEVMRTKKRILIFTRVMAVSFALVCIAGIYQHFTGVEFLRGSDLVQGRVTSSFKAPNDLAAYIILILPVIVSLFYDPRMVRLKRPLAQDRGVLLPVSLFKEQMLLLLILMIGVWCLGFTFSRAAYMVFIIEVLIFGFCQKNKRLTLFLLFFSFAVVFIFSILMVGERAHLNIGNFFIIADRVEYWSEAINMIKDYPLTGVGLNVYSQYGRDFYKIQWGGYPHNCYLQMAAEIGILGLLCFLWMQFNLFKAAGKAFKDMADPFLRKVLMGSVIGLGAFFVQSFFDTFFYSVQLGHFMWLMISMVTVLSQIDGQRTDANQSRPMAKRPINRRRIFLMVLVFTLLVCLETESTKENPRKALEYYQKGVQCESRCSVFRQTRYFQKAVMYDPSLGDAYYHLGMLHEKLRNEKTALKYYRIALGLRGRRSVDIFNVARMYYKNCDFKLAKRFFEYSLKNDPYYNEANYFLGEMYEIEGDYHRALTFYELVREGDKTYDFAVARRGALYYQLGDRARTEAMLEDLGRVTGGELHAQLSELLTNGKQPTYMALSVKELCPDQLEKK